ncbi:beta transducin [Sporothrix epigloea]|uniref:Beta transducin n=1 Tax=Sporothrix epigloea TaxID=1892477 RepID=A0ABP0DZ36_9PEZI
MVKSYLKFEQTRSFGVVASGTSNLIWATGSSPNSFTNPHNTSRSTTGSGHAIVAANEDVLVWDIKKGEQLSRWHDDKNKAQITALAASGTDRDVVAVGYEDGSVRLWDARMATVMVSFNGHRSAVTHLAFDGAGVRLASGAKDTDVVIWDLVAETGLYKLRGHKDQITGLAFVEPSTTVDDEGNELVETTAGDGFLLTTAKDSLIKLWDLSSRHCIETHVAQTNGECWALGVSADLSGCITAGNDGELQVWTLDALGLAASAQQVDTVALAPSTTAVANGTTDEPMISTKSFLISRGTLHRHGKDRTVEISFHPRHDFFAVNGIDKSVEIWRIRSEAEIKRALARKRRRRRERQQASKKKGGADIDMEVEEEEDESLIDISKADVGEIFVQHVIVRTAGKVRSVDWAAPAQKKDKKDLQLLVGTTSNLLELYTISTKKDRISKQAKKDKEEPPEYGRALAVELPGHRTDVRSIALSSDDKMLATAANGSLKIWNVRTQACIRTFECGYALCCAFLPGDKVVLIGTKTGGLELYDVASAALLETVEDAHDNGAAIWSLQVHPDGRSVATGSADKTVKFWDFKIVQEPVLGTTRTKPKLTLVQTRLLKLSDDVLCVRFSPDAKLLAVALLDNTVKVFFVDSLKLYLNLYGHKLPVLSMDISYDSKLIVTSSADKNVKIWGLDFGDCHKSLFAHQDSILQVAFVPHNQDGNGHHFFSCSKDRAVKYWDGDKFEQIQRLDGHFGEIWAMAVSHGGSFVVTASHDKSIRVWNETDEQIFLEEEREREIEQLYESTLATSLERGEDEDPEERDAAGQLGQQVGAASKQTVETLMAGERIAEALELGLADLNLLKEYDEAKARAAGTGAAVAPPQRHLVFMALGNVSAERYVLGVLAKIPAAALHDALLVLPFAQVPALFTFLERFARLGYNMPLTCRVLFFMLKTHHRQIVSSRTMRAMLDDLRASLRLALQHQKDQMGHNMAALRVVGMQVAGQSVKTYVDDSWDAAEAEAAQSSKRKRAFVHVA